jgi:predicted metal-binding protein
MIPKATARIFISTARDLGALEAKLIDAASIVTAPWVRWKCRYGCSGYNTSLCCPPHSPTYLETQAVIASYKFAILAHFKKAGISTSVMCELERRIFLAGYYRAFGMGTGPCRLCKKCNLTRCVHTEQTRPAMEACGIDVYATVRANGYPINVVKEYTDDANFYGLVLIE